MAIISPDQIREYWTDLDYLAYEEAARITEALKTRKPWELKSEAWKDGKFEVELLQRDDYSFEELVAGRLREAGWTVELHTRTDGPVMLLSHKNLEGLFAPLPYCGAW